MSKEIIQNIKGNYLSRKLLLAVFLIVLSFIVILCKLHIPLQDFVSLFRQWCWFMLGIFTIYTGGNVGSKIVFNKDKNKEIEQQQQEVINEEEKKQL